MIVIKVYPLPEDDAFRYANLLNLDAKRRLVLFSAMGAPCYLANPSSLNTRIAGLSVSFPSEKYYTSLVHVKNRGPEIVVFVAAEREKMRVRDFVVCLGHLEKKM
jgi:hypothetical protein